MMLDDYVPYDSVWAYPWKKLPTGYERPIPFHIAAITSILVWHLMPKRWNPDFHPTKIRLGHAAHTMCHAGSFEHTMPLKVPQVRFTGRGLLRQRKLRECCDIFVFVAEDRLKSYYGCLRWYLEKRLRRDNFISCWLSVIFTVFGEKLLYEYCCTNFDTSIFRFT